MGMEYVRLKSSRVEVCEDGQALAEFALIVAFIAAVCVLAATALGLAISGGFGSILPGF
jgi:hypothetical protein